MTAEWACTGCGRHIIGVAETAPPEDGLCAGCRTIGPVRNKALNDWQDGDITEAEFRAIYQNAPPGA